MKKYVFHIILWATLPLLVACRPSGILSQGQLEDVLYDLHMAEATLQVANLASGHDEACDSCYALVLRKHGITQAVFDSSLVWYTSQPQFFNKIYPRIVAHLEEELSLAHQQNGADELSPCGRAVSLNDEIVEVIQQMCAPFDNSWPVLYSFDSQFIVPPFLPGNAPDSVPSIPSLSSESNTIQSPSSQEISSSNSASERPSIKSTSDLKKHRMKTFKRK